MKKTWKSVLAVILAAIMTLGVSTAAAAAAPRQSMAPPLRGTGAPGIQDVGDSLEIVTQPMGTFDTAYGPWDTDLSGMVIKVGGAAFDPPVTVAYDEVTQDSYREAVYDGKINWYFSVEPDWELSDDWNAVGPNPAVLYVWATKYTNFQVQYTDPDTGKEYGVFSETEVFFATAKITVTGVNSGGGLDVSSAVELKPGVPGGVSIPVPGEGEEPESVLFKFTPETGGYYRFTSSGGKYAQHLYTIDGEHLYLPGVYPWGTLYDEHGRWMEYAGFGNAWPDFSIGAWLEKGKAYYLETSCWEGGSYTVSVSPFEARLQALEFIDVAYHDYVDLNTLLAGTTWDRDDLRFYYDGATLGQNWRGFYGIDNGTGIMWIYAPDGASAETRIRVRYSLAQWLCVLFLGGGYWMKWTELGPFSLQREIQNMLGYGIGYSIFDVLSDLGLPYWMISWLLNL